MSAPSNRLRQHADQVESAEQRFYDKNDAIVNRIRSLHEDQDLTQKELAEKLGKSPSYVSRVLGGAVNLTLKTLAEFEEVLDADIITIPSSRNKNNPIRERRRFEKRGRFARVPTGNSSDSSPVSASNEGDVSDVINVLTFGRSTQPSLLSDTGHGVN